MIWHIVSTVIFFVIMNVILMIRIKADLPLWGKSALFFAAVADSVLVFLLFNQFPIVLFILYLNLFITLTILSIEDIFNLYITEWQVVALIVAVVLLRFKVPMPFITNVLSVLLSFILLFVPYLLTGRKGLGIGDVIAFSLISVILTPVEVIIIFFMTVLGGAVYGITMFLISKKKKFIPLIPFIQMSLFVFIPFQARIINFFGFENLYHLQYLIGK